MTKLTIEQLQKRFVELMNLKHQFDAELEQHKQRCIMIQGNLNEIQFQMQSLNPPPAAPNLPTPEPQTPPGDDNATKEGEQPEGNSEQHQDGNCSGEEACPGSSNSLQ